MLKDLHHAIRVLGKARGWTLVVLVSLALGIGAGTALFSAVDGMLFRTLPVADPDGLVRLPALRAARVDPLAALQDE